MRHFLVLACVFSLLVGLSAGRVFGQESDLTIAITVAPNVVNTTAGGQWVTVHADIPLADVESLTVMLNGIPVDWTKADAQGDLVAKFCLDDMLDVIQPPSAELELFGVTRDGQVFIGVDTVKVIEVGSKR